MMNIEVRDRVAVVTGGSSGMGYSIVRELLEAGARVASWDIQDNDNVRALKDEYGDRLMTIWLDVADEASVRQASAEVVGGFGQVDIVVNCAGIMYKAPVESIDMDVWKRINDINVNGTLLTIKHLVPYMKQNNSKRGRIINISSMTALIGLETYIPYSAGKAAVAGMTRVLAAELAPYGITVNALCPGWIDTPMLSGLFDRIADLHKCDRETAIAKVKEHIPQGRFIPPEEIAFTVLFLASPLAQGISGTEFVIDNGLSNTFKPGFHMRH